MYLSKIPNRIKNKFQNFKVKAKSLTAISNQKMTYLQGNNNTIKQQTFHLKRGQKAME